MTKPFNDEPDKDRVELFYSRPQIGLPFCTIPGHPDLKAVVHEEKAGEPYKVSLHRQFINGSIGQELKAVGTIPFLQGNTSEMLLEAARDLIEWKVQELDSYTEKVILSEQYISPSGPGQTYLVNPEDRDAFFSVYREENFEESRICLDKDSRIILDTRYPETIGRDYHEAYTEILEETNAAIEVYTPEEPADTYTILKVPANLSYDDQEHAYHYGPEDEDSEKFAKAYDHYIDLSLPDEPIPQCVNILVRDGVITQVVGDNTLAGYVVGQPFRDSFPHWKDEVYKGPEGDYESLMNLVAQEMEEMDGYFSYQENPEAFLQKRCREFPDSPEAMTETELHRAVSFLDAYLANRPEIREHAYRSCQQEFLQVIGASMDTLREIGKALGESTEKTNKTLLAAISESQKRIQAAEKEH